MIKSYLHKKEQSAISRLLFSFLLGLSPLLVIGQNQQKEIAIGYSIIHEKLPEDVINQNDSIRKAMEAQKAKKGIFGFLFEL